MNLGEMSCYIMCRSLLLLMDFREKSLLQKIAEDYLPDLLELAKEYPDISPAATALQLFFKRFQAATEIPSQIKDLVDTMCQVTSVLNDNPMRTYLQSNITDRSLKPFLTKLTENMSQADRLLQGIQERMEPNSSTIFGWLTNVLLAEVHKAEIASASENINKALDRLLIFVTSRLTIDRKNDNVLSEIRRRLSEPRDFSSVIENHCEKYFMGSRQWIVEEVDKWFCATSFMGPPAHISAASAPALKPVFWLCAGPGMGKSVFAAALVKLFQEADKNNPAALLGAVFFQFNDKSSQDPIRLVQSIIFQIVKGFPLIANELLSVLESDESSLDGIFKNHLIGALKLVEKYYKKKNRLIVFDALDEASSLYDRKNFLTLFTRVEFPSWVKLFVTGRPEKDLEDVLNPFAFVIKENDIRHIKDLIAYIDCSVREVFDHLQGEGNLSEGSLAKATKCVFDKSEGMFLYTAVAIDEVKQWVESAQLPFTWSHFESMISSLPQGMNGCYKKTFTKLKDSHPSLYKNFLFLMVCCKEVLSYDAVEDLLEIDNLTRSSYSFLVNHVKCVFPLINYGNRAYFVPFHKSIVDWLTNEESCGPHLYCNLREANLFITRKLLKISQISSKTKDLSALFPSDIDSLRIRIPLDPVKENAPLPYAIKFLISHLNDAPAMGTISYFLMTNLTWLQISLERFGFNHIIAYYRWLESTESTWLPNDCPDWLNDIKVMLDFFKLLVPINRSDSKVWRRDICTQIALRLEPYTWRKRIGQIVVRARRYLKQHGGWLVRPAAQSSLRVPGGPLEMTLTGHESSITSLCSLLDGRLASASSDGVIKIWNILNGHCDLTWSGHTASRITLFCLSTGRLLSGSIKFGDIKIWNPVNGECDKIFGRLGDIVHQLNTIGCNLLVNWYKIFVVKVLLNKLTSPVVSLCNLPNDRLALALEDGSINIWNIMNGQCEQSFIGFENNSKISLFPLKDGRLVTGSLQSGNIKVWKIMNGNRELTISGRAESSFFFEFDYKNKLVQWYSSFLHSQSTSTRKGIAPFSPYFCPQMEQNFFLNVDFGNRRHIAEFGSHGILRDGRISVVKRDRVQILNAHSRESERELRLVDGLILSLCDIGKGYLATGSSGHMLNIWDLTTGNSRSLNGHEGDIVVLLSLADCRIASGSTDKTIIIWNLKSRDSEPTSAYRFSWVDYLGDDLVASWSWDKIQVWKSNSGVLSRSFSKPVALYSKLCAVSKHCVVGVSPHSFTIWNEVDGSAKVICPPQGANDFVNGVCRMNDDCFAIGIMSGDIMLWNAKSRQCELTIRSQSNNLLGSLHYVGVKRLASTHYDRSFKIWNIEYGYCIIKLSTIGAASLCLLSDGRLASVMGGNISIWNLNKDQCKVSFSHSVAALSHVGGSMLAIGSCNGTITIWNAASSQIKLTLDVEECAITSLCTINYGYGTLACGFWNGVIIIYNLENSQCVIYLKEREEGCAVLSLCRLNNDSLASGFENGTIIIWDLQNPGHKRTLSGHCGGVSSLCYHSDGNMVSGSYDMTLRVWNTIDGECLRVLHGHSGPIYSICRLSDGLIASGSFDKAIKLWNILEVDCVRTMIGHEGSVTSLCCLHDGRLASGSADKMIFIWDLKSFECDLFLQGHEGNVTALCSLIDDEVVSGSTDNTLKIWNLKTGFRDLAFRADIEVGSSLHGLSNNRLLYRASDGAFWLWNLSSSPFNIVIQPTIFYSPYCDNRITDYITLPTRDSNGVIRFAFIAGRDVYFADLII